MDLFKSEMKAGLERGKKLFENAETEGSLHEKVGMENVEPKGPMTRCLECNDLISTSDAVKNEHGAGYLCPGCAPEWNRDNSLEYPHDVFENKSDGLRRGKTKYGDGRKDSEEL